jgi:hypothetical protein
MLLLRDPLSTDPRFGGLFGELARESLRGGLFRASDAKPDGARPRSVVLPCADQERPFPESGVVRMCVCGLSCASSRWRAVMPA